MKKCVLVTGGAGYIGSHTTVELISAGYNVVVADNLSNSEKSAIAGVESIVDSKVEFCQIDCTDKAAFSELFKRYKIDAVIHFAAFKAVGESVDNPLKYYTNNLVSLTNLLELMCENNVSSMVFSSSATVYGQPEELPATEATPRQKATSPYGSTKQIGEDIISDTVLAAAGRIRAIALRYFNPMGAHASSLIGELPRGIPSNLVPFITQTAAGVRECLSVFGDDYNTPDGSALRDYIDVVDLAKAHVVSISRLIEQKGQENYEVFNIGTGKPLSVLELIQIFEKENGVKVNHKIVDRRSGDVEKVWADITKANEVLGWKAEISTEETLKNAWAWEKRLRGL